MKCDHCNDERMFFTVMPNVDKDIGWSSHVISEIDGKCSLYHYQCGGVDPLDVYGMFVDIMKDNGVNIKI